MQRSAQLGIVISALAALFCTAAIWYGTSRACLAFHATPDISEYRLFVDPASGRHESKTFFLFSILIFSLLAFPAYFAPQRWFEEGPFTGRIARSAVMCIWVGALVAGSITESHHALDAAAAIGWKGRAAPNTAVDGICRVAQIL